MSERWGFSAACGALGQGGTRVFEAMHNAFEWLPLSAVVGGRILVLHGGIGGGDWTLADLARDVRPRRACESWRKLAPRDWCEGEGEGVSA